MQRAPKAIAVVTGLIALYFAVAFGYGAVSILASPIYGLENHAFAKTVFDAGRFLDLSPQGILLFAARFGALKLAIAIMFALAVIDKLHVFWGRQTDNAILGAALVLAAAVSLAAMSTALTEAWPDLIRLHGLHLALAVLAASLSIAERIAKKQNESRSSELHRLALQAAADARTPLPPVRGNVTAWRWNLLRRWANPAVD